MTTPERIWAWRWDLPYPSKHQGRREWGDLLMPTEQKVTEYTRADLHEATKAQLAKAVEALTDVHKKAIGLRGDQAYREFARYAEKKTRAAIAAAKGGAA